MDAHCFIGGYAMLHKAASLGPPRVTCASTAAPGSQAMVRSTRLPRRLSRCPSVSLGLRRTLSRCSVLRWDCGAAAPCGLLASRRLTHAGEIAGLCGYAARQLALPTRQPLLSGLFLEQHLIKVPHPCVHIMSTVRNPHIH
nr:unnamed protein product [Digitaria exilis]